MLAENRKNVDLVVKDGKIVTVEGIYEGSVAIDGGEIVAIIKDASLLQADKTIDASGKYVFPGLIDVHEHLGIYLPLESDLETETAAAANGGVTTCMHCITGTPQVDLATEIERITKLAEDRIHVDLTFYASIGSKKQLTEFDKYVKMGVTSFKYFLNRPEYADMFDWFHCDDGELYESWKTLRDLGAFPMCHCENYEIAQAITNKLKQQGVKDCSWDDVRPGFCEYESMTKAALVAKIAKTPVYIVHTTIGAGVDIAAKARSEGVEMILETCPHYLTVSKGQVDNKIEKVNPPIRTKEDIEKLWEGINSGYIKCIGTDNAAVKKEKKIGPDIWTSALTVGNVETMFPVVLTEGLKRGVPLEKIAEICATNNAKVMGIPRKGAIHVGNDADLTIVDLKNKIRFTLEKAYGASDWNVFEGREMIWPAMTISGGNIVAENMEVVGKPGMGKVLKRIPRPTSK